MDPTDPPRELAPLAHARALAPLRARAGAGLRHLPTALMSVGFRAWWQYVDGWRRGGRLFQVAAHCALLEACLAAGGGHAWTPWLWLTAFYPLDVLSLYSRRLYRRRAVPAPPRAERHALDEASDTNELSRPACMACRTGVCYMHRHTYPWSNR